MPSLDSHPSKTLARDVPRVQTERAPVISSEARHAHDEIEFYSAQSDDLKSLYEPSDGRTRPEHASHLNSVSQAARDLYERGATIYGDTLVIPRESTGKPHPTETVRTGTHAHAVREFSSFLEEEKAKEVAAEFVELGHAIAGRTADADTRLVVFQTFYRELTRDERGRLRPREERAVQLAPTLEHMRVLAAAMRAQEWKRERGDFLAIEDWERGSEDRQRDAEHETHGRLTYRIEAIAGIDAERGEVEEGREREVSFKPPDVAYERVSLNDAPPRIPESLSAEDESRLRDEIIPRLDRQIESGVRSRDIINALYREQRAAEFTARTERIAHLFADKTPTVKLERAITRADELRALYVLQTLVPHDARYQETREQINRFITERAPSSGEMFETITDTGTRLAHAHRQQTARLTAYEAAEKERTKLEADASSYRATVRASDEFQTARQRLAADEQAFKLKERAVLSLAAVQQTDSHSPTSNYPELTGGKRLVSEYARLHEEHERELSRSRRHLAEMQTNPEIEGAQAANAAAIEKHRAHFSRLTGREIENAEAARLSLTPQHELTRALLQRLHIERLQLKVSTPKPRTPERQTSERIFVAFSGNDAARVPLANFGEYQVFTRFAREAKLPVRLFESPDLHGGREITDEADARREFYDFAREYVAYRMKDETTRLLNEHRLFREFAARLDRAPDTNELRQTINDIRRENYERAVYPELFAEERRVLAAHSEQLRRPLGHSEMRAVLARPASSHYTDEMRELRLSRSQATDSRSARIRHLERSESSRSPELQTLLREFERTRHDEPARFMRKIHAFLGDYLNPPDNARYRFSSENLYEIGKRLQPVERDVLFKIINETKTALINNVPVRDINRAAFDAHDDKNHSLRLNADAQSNAKTQPDERAAFESPTLRQFLGASLWREANLLSASQKRSSTFAPDARHNLPPSFSPREIEAVAILLAEHRGRHKQLDAVAQYLNASDDSQQRQLGEVVTAFREMRAARAGNGQLRFEITAPIDSLIERDEWAKLLDYFSLHVHDSRSLILPDRERRHIKREALASAWREIESQELRRPELLLDAKPESLSHAIAAQRDIQRGRELQERTRTAADALASHFNIIVNQATKEIAKTDPIFSADAQTIEPMVRFALSSDSTHSKTRNIIDESDGKQRELFTLTSRSISPRDREQYRMLSDFVARSKRDYVENFFRIDERIAALALSARESRSFERPSYTQPVEIALGRELKRLIETDEAEKLIEKPREEEFDRVRELLPDNVRVRARETGASGSNERAVHEPSSSSLRATLEKRVSDYLTSAVREGGAETLRADRSATLHAHQVSRIIIEIFSERGRDLSVSPDDMKRVELASATLVSDINTEFNHRTRASVTHSHVPKLGDISRPEHLSPQHAAQLIGRTAISNGELERTLASRASGQSHDNEIVEQKVKGTVAVLDESSSSHVLQATNHTDKPSPHKQTAPELAADAHDLHFRHYVLTR